MLFQEWLALSDAERLEDQKRWRPNEDGYWQTLLREAAARFRCEFSTLPHVVDFNYGMYHGGTLILGVVTDLPVSQRVEVPSNYLGFPVLQFHRSAVPGERANV
jgi:hypothetical protein